MRPTKFLLMLAAAHLFQTGLAMDLTTPEGCLDAIRERTSDLLAKDQPSLFAWHLRSIRSLFEMQYATLLLEPVKYRERSLAEHQKEFIEYASRIATGLAGDCSSSEPYLKGGVRGLVLARPSEMDGTLQYMMVDLPKDWDPGKAYPLMVGLHGSGPDDPLAYPSFGFFPADPKAKPNSIIRLAPWGRGNRSWRGDAEEDLFEALKLLHTFAKTDHDRWYITGHSSGGDGVWSVIHRTPDLWAAAGVQSGSMLGARPELGLLENIKHLPVHILIGEDDTVPFRVPDSKEMHLLQEKQGGTSKLVILPKVGHYPLTPEGLAEQEQWMMQYTRRRPNAFTFKIDKAAHPGIWGITAPLMAWTHVQILNPWPSISCEIEGETVKLQTTGMPSVRVDFGSKGLGLTGKVKLELNGKVRYEGPVPEMPAEYKL